MAESIMQTEKACYITGDTRNLHRHHIYFSANRKNSEKYGCWVWLRADWHNMAPYGVHGRDGRELDLRLKRECQAKFEETHSREEFMRIFGRNYLG